MNSLILSGGGSFGAFEAGVLYHIFHKKQFDKCLGTSVGALNCLLMAQAYLNKSPEIFKTLWIEKIKSNKQIYKKNRFKYISFRPPYNFDPLKFLLKEVIDFEKIIKMEKEIVLSTVDLITGKSVTISNHDKDLTPKDLLNAAIASCSVPPLFPPVIFKNKILVDGGIRDNAPVSSIIQSWELDSILIILCNNKDLEYEKREYEGLFEISDRVINIMMNEITNNDISIVLKINDMLRKMNENEKGEFLKSKKVVDLNLIYPEESLNNNMLNFNPRFLRRAFLLGIKKGIEFLGKKIIPAS